MRLVVGERSDGSSGKCLFILMQRDIKILHNIGACLNNSLNSKVHKCSPETLFSDDLDAKKQKPSPIAPTLVAS